MPQTLTGDDLKALVVGTSFYGCGGGGSREEGIKVLSGVRNPQVADLDELPEDSLIASPYACGSLESETKAKVFKELVATLELEKFMDCKFCALFPTELGGYNTAVVFKVASEMGIPVTDGDGAGRAVPEIQHSIPSMLGYPATPTGVALPNGDALVVTRAESDRRLEDIIRHIVSKFGNVGVCDHPLKVKDAKRSLVLGSISKAIRVGYALLERNLGKALREAGAEIVAEGKITQVALLTEGGFTKGKTKIDPDAEVTFKNENMELRCREKTFRFPDLIILLERKTILPVENPPQEGAEVVVAVAKADERWYKLSCSS